MIIFLAVVAVGVVIGYARGGTLRNLATAQIRGLPLVLVAVLLQALAWQVVPARLDVLAYAFVLVSYALVFSFAFLNRRAPWMWLVGIGAFLNFLVIVLNAGMPTSPTAAARIGYNVEEAKRYLLMRGKHVLESDATRLRFLGDVIPIPGDRSLASVGDLVIWAGLALLLQSLMVVRSTSTDGLRARQPADAAEPVESAGS